MLKFYLYFRISVFYTFQYRQRYTQINVLGLYAFVPKLPEDSNNVPKYVGV